MNSLAKYPRLVASLFSALSACLIAAIICSPMDDFIRQILCIGSAIISTAFWAAIVAKRIADINQSCTYFRAGLLGGITVILATATIGLPLDLLMRLRELSTGTSTLQQVLRNLLIDDWANNIGCGLFALLAVGWFVFPFGCLAGIFLRMFREKYKPITEGTSLSTEI